MYGSLEIASVFEIKCYGIRFGYQDGKEITVMNPADDTRGEDVEVIMVNGRVVSLVCPAQTDSGGCRYRTTQRITPECAFNVLGRRGQILAEEPYGTKKIKSYIDLGEPVTRNALVRVPQSERA